MPSGHPCYLTIAGERKSVAEWAIIAGIPKGTILERLRRTPGLSASLAVFGEAEKAKPKRGRPKVKPLPVVANMSRWGSVESVNFGRVA